jgi:hypothetical protein
MPAPLLRDDQIPALVDKLSLRMRQALRFASRFDFVRNDSAITQEEKDVFGQLAEAQCLDPAVVGNAVDHWSLNHNGSRVLKSIDAAASVRDDDDAPPDVSSKWLRQ